MIYNTGNTACSSKPRKPGNIAKLLKSDGLSRPTIDKDSTCM